jgi:phospholipid/cholesterol/gamma-HCH transport system permease protein
MTIAEPQQTRPSVPVASFSAETGSEVLRLSGSWTMANAREAETQMLALAGALSKSEKIAVDLKDVSELDTLGAWLIARLQFERSDPRSVRFTSLRKEHGILLEEVGRLHRPEPKRIKPSAIMTVLSDIGETVIDAWRDLVAGIAFLGGIIAAMGRLMLHPSRFRFTAMINHCHADFDAGGCDRRTASCLSTPDFRYDRLCR